MGNTDATPIDFLFGDEELFTSDEAQAACAARLLSSRNALRPTQPRLLPYGDGACAAKAYVKIN